MPTEQLRVHTATDDSAGQTGLGNATRRLLQRATSGPTSSMAVLADQTDVAAGSLHVSMGRSSAGRSDASSGDRGHHPLGVACRAFAAHKRAGKLSTAQSNHPSKRLWAFGAQMFGYFSIFKEKNRRNCLQGMCSLVKEKDEPFS